IPFLLSETHLLIENCKFKGEIFAIVYGKDSTVHIKNSEFADHSGILGFPKHCYVENSKFIGSSMLQGARVATVVKDSLTSGQVGDENQDALYMINNAFAPYDPNELIFGRTVLLAKKDTGLVYLEGNRGGPAFMNMVSGNFYVRDVNAKNLIIGNLDGKKMIVTGLDFENVNIDGLLFPGDLNVKNARWRNVAVSGEIQRSSDSKVNITINARDVRFPLRESGLRQRGIKIVESAAPFKFPKIKVPTLSDFGMEP
ncbi:MAG: hypothetical protein LBE01_01415, partial [Deltaproteobacteria bacterium]|nr:hypothetical protein [Deltaproteobacteria bacterium]